jgi:hypothetical protein
LWGGVYAKKSRAAKCRFWVKNGRDALEMGCLYCPRKQTSVSYAVDCDLIVCYGGAKLTHKHLASKIHCVDDEIIAPVLIETSLRDLMENLCALNGRSLPRQSQFI